MANKKVQYKDIAEEGLLDPLIKDFKQLNELLNEAKKEIIAIAKANNTLSKQNPLKSYDDIEDVEKGIDDVGDALKKLDKIERERLKLEERQAQLNDQRKKDNILLNEQIKQQTKELRDQAKASLDSANAYKKLTKETNDAQAEFKRLAAEFGENSKEAKAARKEFLRLDKALSKIDKSANDGRRKVGLYEKGVKSLTNTVKGFFLANVILKSIELFTNAFNQNTEAAGGFQKIIARVTVTFAVFVNRLTGGLDKIQLTLEKWGKELELTRERLKVFSSNQNVIAKLEKEIENLEKRIEAQPNIFKGFIHEVDNLIDKNDDLIDKTIKYRKEIIGLEKSLSGLRTEQQALEIASDDNTLSLEAQTQATLDLIEKSQEVADLEEKIARKRFELARQNADIQKGNLEAQEEEAAAFVELQQAQFTATATRLEGERRLREIERDNIELDLDQLIDIADKRKTINEQIAADERNTFEERRAALNQATQDIEASFRRQAEVIQQGTGISFNIDDLINEQDTIKLNERIKALGLDEIRQNRLREIIQERIQATQDLQVAQSDLNDSEAEARDLNSEILLQEEALLELQKAGVKGKKVLEQLQEKTLQNEIDNLRARKALTEDGSLIALEIQNELNDKLIQQQQNRIEKELEAEKKKQERMKEIQETAFTALRAFQEKQSEKRLEQIDKEISAEADRESELRELAAQGNEDAQRNLALQQQRQAELQRQREQEVQRAQRTELALSAIETYSAKVQAGDKNPLASTIADTQLLLSFINSLPAFWEGAEKVGDKLDPVMSGRDGHVVRVDGSERILTGEQNKMIGNMSNMELAMLAHTSQMGKIKSKPDSDILVLKHEMRRVAKAIEDKPAYMGLDYDAQSESIMQKYIKKGRMERKHRKTGGIWGK